MNEILKTLKINKTSLESNVGQFRKDLLEDPFHAFSWSLETFNSVSELKVVDQLIEAIEKKDSKVTKESLSEYILGQVVNRAKNPSRSTNPVDNLLQESLNSAYAKYYGFFND